MQDVILKDNVHRASIIDAHTWNISEADLCNCYLLEGEDHALLIDIGCGAGDLRKCVKQLTKKSLSVAVTHRHPDHVGGCGQFGFYYAHKDDCTKLYDMMCLPMFRMKMIPENLVYNPSSNKKTEVYRMKEDMEFDLGGRTIRTEHIPGHTKGSVMFIDDTNRYIFTGDDVNPVLWMHLPGCTSLKTWLAGAERVLYYLNEGYQAFYGHGDGIQTKEQVETTIRLVKQIIEETENGRKIKDGCLCDGDSDIRVLFSPKRIQ